MKTNRSEQKVPFDVMAMGLAMVLLVLFAVVSVVNMANAEIALSAHDFSSQSFTTEVCNVCHTPHGADTTVTEAPLWDHEISVAVYSPYVDGGNGTLDATISAPSGLSKLCLSCHDGTIAVDNFGGVTTGTATIGTINAGADLGIDLTDDHPVGFVYGDALAGADGELRDPTSYTTVLGGVLEDDLLFGSGLPGTKSLECASCHDVHNADNNDSLLRISNTASVLCLTCHIK